VGAPDIPTTSLRDAAGAPLAGALFAVRCASSCARPRSFARAGLVASCSAVSAPGRSPGATGGR